jgi:regulation of enolase protein 1 (concanavalin A-like superfamily)
MTSEEICSIMSEKIELGDRFENVKLLENWSWVRERSVNWRIAEGELQIRTRPGSLMEDSNNAENLLIRPLSNTFNGFSAIVSCELAVPYEQAGLLWYYDDDNYIKLVKELVGEELAVVLVREEDAKASVLGKIALSSSTDAVELQFFIVDEVITGQFRISSAAGWITVAQCAAYPQQGLHAGLFTHGGEADADRWVRFSSFAFLKI